MENTINFAAELDGTTILASDTCQVTATSITPSVEICKVADLKEASVGDVITYRVDITIGDGDKLTDQIIKDVSDDRLQLVDGTLMLDGELLDPQDLSAIAVDFDAPSYHYLTYQCKRIY